MYLRGCGCEIADVSAARTAVIAKTALAAMAQRTFFMALILVPKSENKARILAIIFAL